MIHKVIKVETSHKYHCVDCGLELKPEHEEFPFAGDSSDKILEKVSGVVPFARIDFCTDKVYDEFIELTMDVFISNNFLFNKMFNQNPKKPQVNRLESFKSEK